MARRRALPGCAVWLVVLAPGALQAGNRRFLVAQLQFYVAGTIGRPLEALPVDSCQWVSALTAIFVPMRSIAPVKPGFFETQVVSAAYLEDKVIQD